MDTSFELAFSLPNDDWETVQPPADLMFLALRRGDFADYRPNIAVDSAELLPDATLTDVANSTAIRLQRFDAESVVTAREVVEEGDQPHALQTVAFGVTIDAYHVDLLQYQTIIPISDTASDRRWVLCFTLTAEADTINAYGPDYEAFITSVEAVPPTLPS